MPLLLSLLAPLLGKIVDTVGAKLGVDTDSEVIKTKKLEAALEIQKLVTAVDLKQLDINIAEASNPGRQWPTWREMLGYICVLAVGYHFVFQQFMAFVLSAAGHQVILPALDMTGIMTILSAMLGVHFVDSRYNSPAGEMPKLVKAAVVAATNTDPGKGRLVVNEEGDTVWKMD